jgi:hypothetical protein
VVDLEILENNYFVNMSDVPYELKKGGTIYIKPVLVKDYNIYMWAKEILLIDKNEISDIDIIQMSYLEFLIKNVLTISSEMVDKICWLIKLTLNEEHISIGNNCLIICEDDKTIKYIISSKEFNDISKIIQAQNDPNYDDRYVSPEVKELMAEYYKVKYKSVVTPSLEKKKAFVSSKTGKTFLQLNELPCREFELIYDACKDSEIYIGQKIIQGSYKYEVKEDIKHPLFAEKQDPYEELFTDTSTLASKGINGAEQLTAMNLQQSLTE